MKINLKKKGNYSSEVQGEEGCPSTPPPQPLRMGVWICSYVRGLIFNRSVNRNGKKINLNSTFVKV